MAFTNVVKASNPTFINTSRASNPTYSSVEKSQFVSVGTFDVGTFDVSVFDESSYSIVYSNLAKS